MMQHEEWSLQIRWVRAHTTEKKRKKMTEHQKFVTFGDKADELAMLDSGDDSAEFADIVAQAAQDRTLKTHNLTGLARTTKKCEGWVCV